MQVDPDAFRIFALYAIRKSAARAGQFSADDPSANCGADDPSAKMWRRRPVGKNVAPTTRRRGRMGGGGGMARRTSLDTPSLPRPAMSSAADSSALHFAPARRVGNIRKAWS